MGPTVIAASNTQVKRADHSMSPPRGRWAILWLSIAFRRMQMRLGLFGVAIGTVTLPMWCATGGGGEMELASELSRCMRLAVSVDVPSPRAHDAGRTDRLGALSARPFGRASDAQAAGASGTTQSDWAGYAALKVLVGACYALDRRKTPCS